MDNRITLPYNADRIIHEWKKRRKAPLFLEVSLFILIDVIVFPISVLSILGYRHILGIQLGEPSLKTYFGIFGWLFINYDFFSNLINKTIIDISPQTLYIRITPLPWPSRNHIPINDIKQFQVVEEAHKFGRRVLYKEYSVHALFRNGDVLPIIYNIGSKDTADDYLIRIEKAIGRLST